MSKLLATDESGQRIASYLASIAGSKLNPEGFSMEDIARIVRNGDAADVFDTGDQIVTTRTVKSGAVYTMPFDIVDFQNVLLESGETVPGMIIQSHFATTESVQFDAPEPNNANSDIQKYGYNRWSESGYRAWLNSAEDAGAWFGATFERDGITVDRRAADVAPTQLNSIDGFLKGMEDDFLSVIRPVRITTATNTVTDDGSLDVTYDRFFLPSLENICVSPQAAAGSEGGNWAYWKQRVGTTKRATGKDFARGITYALEAHTSAQIVRLRSANRGTAYNVWNVNASGSAYDYSAHNAYRCAPACVIC